MENSGLVGKTVVREPFIKLVRLVARVFYDDYTTRSSDNQQKSAKSDNRGIAVVVLDALARRQWVTEEDLAEELKLNAKQLRKTIRHFEEQKLIMCDMRKTRAKIYRRAEEKVKFHTQTYCCLDYSQIYDIVRWKLHWFKKKLKGELEDKNTIQEYGCPKCKRKYNALDALRLISMEDDYFHCENCNGELVLEECNTLTSKVVDGADNASRLRKEKLKDLLQTLEVRLKPLMDQINRMKDLSPPEIESLTAWEARVAMAARVNGDLDPSDTSRSQGGFGSTPMPFLGETRVEVKLGEGKEDDGKSEGGDSRGMKVVPPWMIRQGMNLTDEQRGVMRQEAKVDDKKSAMGNGDNDDKKSAMGNGDNDDKDLEACFREAYLKEYYVALWQKQQELANQQESVQLATTSSSDRQVGMKSKRDEEDVEWEEEVSVTANGDDKVDLDMEAEALGKEEEEDDVEWEEG